MLNHPHPRHPAPEAFRRPQVTVRLFRQVSEGPVLRQELAGAVQVAAGPEEGEQAAAGPEEGEQAAAGPEVQGASVRAQPPLVRAAQQQAQAPPPVHLGPQTNHGCTSHISHCVPRPQEGSRSA